MKKPEARQCGKQLELFYGSGWCGINKTWLCMLARHFGHGEIMAYQDINFWKTSRFRKKLKDFGGKDGMACN
ncbi:unnamed protein product [Lathyrus oleraceus]